MRNFYKWKILIFSMVKCDICGTRIDTTFLNKILGTVVRDNDGKKKTVCRNCQIHHNKDDLREVVSETKQ